MFTLEGRDKPLYTHCTLETCKICYKIEIAKLIFLLQGLIKEKSGE